MDISTTKRTLDGMNTQELGNESDSVERAIEIVVRVQHHPSRKYPLQRLMDRLDCPRVEISEHSSEPPSPMAGYLRCLADPPPDATHLLVIQDDAYPCGDFDRRMREAISERPDDVVSLFVGGLTSRTKRDFLQALKAGERWSQVYFREIHHVVALVWPVGLAQEFLDWFPTARIPGPKIVRSDDAAVGFWVRTRRPRMIVWATVPCLVEHLDDLPSVVQGNRRLGDKGRKAIHWIDS